MHNVNSTMVINVNVEICSVKYFRGYLRPMKINQNEYLTHE